MSVLNSRPGRVVALLLVLLSVRAAAQDQDAAGNTAAARVLFEEGVGLADHGSWREAADRFRRSLELRDSPVVAFNLATALVQVGELVEASELFRRTARDTDTPQGLRDAAQHALDEVTPRLGQLVVTLDGPRDRLSLRLDSHDWPMAAVGVSAPVDPGSHVMHALRDGGEVANEQVQVPEGGRAETLLRIPALPAGRVERGAGGGDVTSEAWFWVVLIGSIVAVAATVTIIGVAATSGGPGTPISGNLMPGVLEFGP